MKITLIDRSDPVACMTAAGLCYNAKDPYKALLNAIECGHESVLEHCKFTFKIEYVSRVLLAQLTRHRIASFSVQSQRYCGADMDLVIPESMRLSDLVDEIVKAKMAVEKLYNHAIKMGVPQEDARYLTFQAGATKLVMTMNVRELRHFFSLRCCNRAQWEIREMADEMLRVCREQIPFMFDNAGPGCVNTGCPEGKRSCGKPRRNDEWN